MLGSPEDQQRSSSRSPSLSPPYSPKKNHHHRHRHNTQHSKDYTSKDYHSKEYNKEYNTKEYHNKEYNKEYNRNSYSHKPQHRQSNNNNNNTHRNSRTHNHPNNNNNNIQHQPYHPRHHKRSCSEMEYENGDLQERNILKKQKISENNNNNNNNDNVKVSKVLHCRNIPSDTTESELITLASPFGNVTNVLILKGKNQAFLQLHDQQSAQSMIQFYSSTQPSLRGKSIFIQYSKREEITITSDSNNNKNNNNSNSNNSPNNNNNNNQIEAQSPILLVTILNVQYAITIDVLQRVFSKFGQILKIIIFTKNGSFQSFVQYGNISSASAAKQELDNQNIYSGCCTLKIQYSQLSNLNVKYNNEKCRDFTNPNLPPGSDSQLPLFPDPVPHWGPQSSYHSHSYNKNSNSNSSAVLIASGIDNLTPDELFTLFGVYGDVIRVKILYNKKDTCLLQFATPQQATTAMENLDGLSFRGRNLKISYSKFQSISLPKSNDDNGEAEFTKDFSNSPLHRYKIVGSKNFQHITPPSSVLHLSNVPLSVNEEDLTDIFHRVSPVVAVKFFTKDRRMALVEFSSIERAVEALIVMHDYSIDEQNIRVSFSKSAINSR